MHEIIHTIIREFRIEFLLENYSFQYKITNIMGITVSFIIVCHIYKFIDLSMRVFYMVC